MTTSRPEPVDIRQEGPSLLGITWSDGLTSSYPVRALRQACPCAHCIDEHTGRPLLNPASVPMDIHPVKLEAVGRYAIRIRWSDGHETGLYSFELLRQLHPRPREEESTAAAESAAKSATEETRSDSATGSAS